MKVIEEVDSMVPIITELNPDVLVVTGDHSTPAALASHSWHPLPVLLSSATCRPDRVDRFGESKTTYDQSLEIKFQRNAQVEILIKSMMMGDEARAILDQSA